MTIVMSQEGLRAHLAQGDLLTLREALADLHPADLRAIAFGSALWSRRFQPIENAA